MATKTIDITEIERATKSARTADAKGRTQARKVLRRADRAIDGGRLSEVESWVVEIVRDELEEALATAR